MRQFVKTRFFALLAGSNEENLSVEVYREATGEFVDELWETCREETDLALLYRKLEHARIWLESWQEHAGEDGGMGKKRRFALRECGVEFPPSGTGVVAQASGAPG